MGNDQKLYDLTTADLPDLAANSHVDNEAALREALRRHEFILYYQPRVDLKTGKMRGVEALIRWQRQGRGIILPAEFIPVAEKTGMIDALTEWVLHQACVQAKKWSDLGFKDFTVSINISAQSFKNTQLLDAARRIFIETGVNPALLEFEITETGLMQNIDIASKVVNDLKEMNVQIAIDDFGTGYSSFSYLHRFSVDSLKIDRSFITEIPHRVADMAIVTAITAMSHALGIKVVAEGVEKLEQVIFLKDNGCDEIQGYYFCKPVMVDEITHLLMTDASLTVA